MAARALAGCLGLLLGLGGCAGARAPALGPRAIEGGSIVRALAPEPGDPGRGREIVTGRAGNCLLCHALPESGARFMGNLGPPLSGIGARLGAGELRARIVDPLRFNPEAAMPSYYRVKGLNHVGAPWRGKPILSAQEVEDVVAYLLTLR